MACCGSTSGAVGLSRLPCGREHLPRTMGREATQATGSRWPEDKALQGGDFNATPGDDSTREFPAGCGARQGRLVSPRHGGTAQIALTNLLRRGPWEVERSKRQHVQAVGSSEDVGEKGDGEGIELEGEVQKDWATFLGASMRCSGERRRRLCEDFGRPQRNGAGT